MTQEKLTEVLELHKKWVRGENGGVRADLNGAALRGATLRRADLNGADLSGATMRRADLNRADLSVADLSGANLSGADLNGAALLRANLSGANLSGADLRGADLSGANLSGANLSGADLSGADLRGAIKAPIHCKWSHGITEGQIHIGCKRMSIDEWDEFFASDKEFDTKRGTSDFKQIQAVYNAYRAYLTPLNEEH